MRATIKIDLSNKERKELRKLIQKTKERKFADRLRVILYKADGYEHKEIASMLQMGKNQVTKIIKLYSEEGLDSLLKDNYKGSEPKLNSEQRYALKIELATNIYNTATQAIAWVEKQWNICYSVDGMHKLLKRLGFTYKKNRLVPSQADPEKQRHFIQWFRKISSELGPNDRIYFSDAAHVKHNAEAGYAWSLSGKPHRIPTNSGRQRYNVLGAYCIQTHEHLFILTEDNINQYKMIELIEKLRTKHPGEGEIYLIMDNASYNKAKLFRTQAIAYRVYLWYLPPYSPNLNIIERLWKFMRKEFCKDKYRRTFPEFRTQLDFLFANLDQYRTKLESLLTENFELILTTDNPKPSTTVGIYSPTRMRKTKEKQLIKVKQLSC